jgi:hypothetical protein
MSLLRFRRLDHSVRCSTLSRPLATMISADKEAYTWRPKGFKTVCQANSVGPGVADS